MRIKSIKIERFRRFQDLQIGSIPKEAKLVVLAGPNGSGKSSLFDAMLLLYRSQTGFGWNGDVEYYNRAESIGDQPFNNISIDFHHGDTLKRGSVYIRSAYRHDPEFTTNNLVRQGEVLDALQLQRLIEMDAVVSKNYARLASRAMEDVFVKEAATTTLGSYRDKTIGEVRDPLKRMFPDLVFTGVGNPMERGTFHFQKGATKDFAYGNLSGGEKAAFDLILDLIVKRKSYNNSIYCVDEPELHMNTRVQGSLLVEMLGLVPDGSQLWIASHSIGMMRKAREIHDTDPSSVAFIDFGGHDFDKPVVITPTAPTRAFWATVLHVALDDLAHLVAPRAVVICEGNPLTDVPGKNVEHDARVYGSIFAAELPDVTFISAGSSNQVSGDFLGLATALPKIAVGMQVIRIIDLDDHSPTDVADLATQGITVLSRRHLEAYLFDDEILEALCLSVGRAADTPAILAVKQQAISDSVMSRHNPADDIKSAAGKIYTEAKRILALKQVGNDTQAFARNTLAPLVKPGTATYAQLKQDIFG